MKDDSEIISMNIISKVWMKIEWLYLYYIQNNNSSGKISNIDIKYII